MPIIDGKEYPRLENGVVVYEPKVAIRPKAQPKPAAKKKTRKKTS